MRLLIRSISLFFFLLSLGLHAQTSEPDTLLNKTLNSDTIVNHNQLEVSGKDLSLFKRKHFATFSIGSFVNITPGIQLGYEYLLLDKFSVLGEAGYLFNFTENRQGFRLKAEGRLYFSKNVFLGLEAANKRTITQVNDWVDVETHEQRMSFRGIRSLVYFGPKFGINIPLNRDDRFFFELASTFAFANYKVFIKGLPEEYSPIGDNRGILWNDSFAERQTSFPMAFLSFKFKYNFGRTV